LYFPFLSAACILHLGMQFFKNIFADALHLFYPHGCSGCGSDVLENGNLLCLRCLHDLPHTRFAQHANNPVEKYFWGRLPLQAAHSEFYFAKESLLQHLIHRLKYKGDQELGMYLGEMMANSLVNAHRFGNIDGLIPLPMFPAKERKRGYNQATVICNGMSPVMNLPVIHNNVIRRHATETQTRKHRTERWDNAAGSFMINKPEQLIGKHWLLVDDVITTGATLEACGQMMAQLPGIKLSIATLALAGK